MSLKFTINGHAGKSAIYVIVNILSGIINTFLTTGIGDTAQLRVTGDTVIS